MAAKPQHSSSSANPGDIALGLAWVAVLLLHRLRSGIDAEAICSAEADGRPLDAGELMVVRDWIARHDRGWGTLVYTPEPARQGENITIVEPEVRHHLTIRERSRGRGKRFHAILWSPSFGGRTRDFSESGVAPLLGLLAGHDTGSAPLRAA
jgi:hypothetical protein